MYALRMSDVNKEATYLLTCSRLHVYVGHLRGCLFLAYAVHFFWIQFQLICSDKHCVEVLPVRLSTVGKRAFPVSVATVWNDLPLHVSSAPSLAVFRQQPRHYHMTRVLMLLLPFITTFSQEQFRRPGTAFVEQSSCWTPNIRRWAGHVQTQTEYIFV